MSSSGRKIKIVAFSGALRKSSANAGLVRAAAELAKGVDGIEFEVVTDLIGQLPLYDGDIETEGFKGVVKQWREVIRSADALLIATPEYNYSIPGTLKNAIDWASRPDDQTYSSFPTFDKPVAIMGAGGGMGTSRAQYHLRQVGVYLNWHFVNRPEVNVNLWGGKQIADSDGNLIDDATRGQVKALLDALVEWTKRLNAGKFGAGASAEAKESNKTDSDSGKKEKKAKKEKKEKKAKKEKSSQ
ncbi:NADPHdependent FMN reductase domain containing protein [Acanthamoeba castellanii str. Neff]|uniref:NADPHdependent FMN reductase domain containing protein n=1 Tax=Acanthamoeba castellanii (strain ATCC 30010 / Neff) TaxID=1257118 RepID=L8HI57_ACACF|nr:NADPHdependent FMN reductase domain containing protein [Acanthamoeba castellanii str. Neff]ELR24902.1 NADPHdependent FMN reductase domain containing protein [Acanthamoeba castellanii str. Neff]